MSWAWATTILFTVLLIDSASVITEFLGTELIALGASNIACFQPPINNIATLFVIVYKLIADYIETIEYKPQNWHSLLAGAASGFGSALANAGAPPFTIYMLLKKVEPIPFIGTATLFFAVINLLKLPIFVERDLIQINAFIEVIWALPIVPLGVWLGRRSLEYISQTTFERIMLALLFLTVILLFVTSLS